MYFSFLCQVLWLAMGRPGSSSDDLRSPPCAILGWGRRASRSESRRKLIFWWSGSGTHVVGHGVCACWETLHVCNETMRGVGLFHPNYDPRNGHVAAVSAPCSSRQSCHWVWVSLRLWDNRRDKYGRLVLESILYPVLLEEQDRKW